MTLKDKEGEGASEVTLDEHGKQKRRHTKSERPTDRDHEHRHHRSSKSSRTKPETSTDSHSPASGTRQRRRRTKPRDSEESKDRRFSASDLLSGVSRVSLDRERSSLPYPSFSKAHSKEAVHSRENVAAAEDGSPLTPEATDVSNIKQRPERDDGSVPSPASKTASPPPTPPETDVSATSHPTEGTSKHGADSELRMGSSRGDSSKVSRQSRSSSQATFVKRSTREPMEKLRSESRTSSNPLPVGNLAHLQSASKEKLNVFSSKYDASAKVTSAPRTPLQRPASVQSSLNQTCPATLDFDEGDGLSEHASRTATPASAIPVPPPPPPPPPPPAVDILDIPRVDYLLQNGGLAYPVPKNFLSVLPRQNGTRPSNPPLAGADTLFAPFFNLLEQYSAVIARQGSIAVATGHRSVARRLLDRLENVFSRDLPPHGCACIMCEKSHEIHRGLTWGDVLEWVSGRIELPPWPPFELTKVGSRGAELLAEASARPPSPVAMDPDIGEEFREHYLRQNKKVKSAVDKWLNNTDETPAPAPQDVDDETLSFAVLTNLVVDDRPYFNALLTGARELKPATRAPTPIPKTRNDFIVKSGLSLQRLYRLSAVPRDAECALYLVKNPHTHDLLITISNINTSEWEILTSGRFDGFLWSGADGDDAIAALDSRGMSTLMSPGFRGLSRAGSRNVTPFSNFSRGPTPASFVNMPSSSSPANKQPVSNDEEMEMAAIAEIEREVYTGMETLEDAFERLHHKAELVRNALRQRGAGLMQSFQNRKRIDILSTPAPNNSQTPAFERMWATSSEGDLASDSEWGADDIDIMPDDSASNISSSRHRRPKRRTERRTPAPIEEDDEEP